MAELLIKSHMHIEIVYGHAKNQTQIEITVPVNTTVRDAIKASGILNLWPEINLDQQKVGIFSKLVTLDTLLQNNDRIEIYRPLSIDPKEARKNRLKKKA